MRIHITEIDLIFINNRDYDNFDDYEDTEDYYDEHAD